MKGLRRRLSGDSGAFMTNTITGAVLNLLTVLALASAVAGMAFYNLNTAKHGEQTAAIALAESTLRDDISWAGTVIPDGPRAVTFESAAGDGRCRAARWAITSGSQGINLTVSTSLSAFTADGRCENVPSGEGDIMLSGVGPDSVFQYLNAGGRSVDEALNGEPAPDGVRTAHWESTDVAAVALEVTAGYDTNREARYRISQLALNLYAKPSSPDAATTQVPEGNLRR